MTNPLVVLSGGLDSTCALALALQGATPGSQPAVVSFDYGQRHTRELQYAAKIARHYGITHRIIGLADLLIGTDALTGDTPVPHGHYAADNMAATVVAGRNLVFAACAVAEASRVGCDQLWLGVHAGDHPVYPDCRPNFWRHLGEAISEAYDVQVNTPFIHRTKAELLAIGASLNAPLDLTWSCYEGGQYHCGRCGTCVERAEAFDAAGVADPTVYVDPDYWRVAGTDTTVQPA